MLSIFDRLISLPPQTTGPIGNVVLSERQVQALLRIVGLIIVCVLAAWFASVGAANIVRLDSNADLNRYLSASSDLVETFAEPLSTLLFDLFYVVSQWAGLPWLLPATVALAVSGSLYCARINSGWLKLFWLIALVPMLALVNVRNGLLFLLLPFLSGGPLILAGLLVHWGYMVLLVDVAYRSRKVLIALILGTAVFSLVFASDSFFIFAKVVHYFNDGEGRQYGPGIFLFQGLLWFGLRRFYVASNSTSIAFDSVMAFALLTALAGLPIPAGRLSYLAILLSSFNLRDKYVNSPVGIVPVMSLLLALAFQFYLFSSMTGLAQWQW